MNISIDLAPGQIKFLERMLKLGEYRSRSEIVRDIIRRAEFEWAWKKGMAEAERTGISEDIETERESAYKKISGKFKYYR